MRPRGQFGILATVGNFLLSLGSVLLDFGLLLLFQRAETRRNDARMLRTYLTFSGQESWLFEGDVRGEQLRGKGLFVSVSTQFDVGASKVSDGIPGSGSVGL